MLNPGSKEQADTGPPIGGADQLVTVISNPSYTKASKDRGGGGDKPPDSPTQTSFFFSPLARSRNQRRRTSCTPCNTPPIRPTSKDPTRPPASNVPSPSPPPNSPLPPSPPPNIPLPPTPPPNGPLPPTPTAPPDPSRDPATGTKPRSTIVVTVRMPASAARHDGLGPPPSPWPKDAPFSWPDPGDSKPGGETVFVQSEANAMELDPSPLGKSYSIHLIMTPTNQFLLRLFTLTLLFCSQMSDRLWATQRSSSENATVAEPSVLSWESTSKRTESIPEGTPEPL